MQRVAWMAAASLVSALVLAASFGREVWLGMAGPLLVVSASWLLTERVYTENPERFTSMMVGAFVGKLVVFGAYVVLAVGVLGVQPVPFAVSFAGYFIVLHTIEALWLKRLFAS